MPIGQLFIISAPSGAGKTSLISALLARVTNLVVSVSHTTRVPRLGEVDGRDYYFSTENHFQSLLDNGALLEHAQVFGNFYGTSTDAVTTKLRSGVDVILEIDWQGAIQVRALSPDVISIFILPPTRNTLQERLLEREKDDSSIIIERMAEADETIEQAPNFNYWVINDDFETALDQLKSIIASHRQRRQQVKARHPNFLEKLLGQR